MSELAGVTLEFSSELGALVTALSAAQGEFSAIPKTEDNPFFKSKYADLATVVGHTAPIIAKHGIAVSQFPTTLDGEPALSTYLMHKSGQFIKGTMKLCAAKQDPQGQGAAITYARRFSYMAVLGLVADDDDDGNRATRAKQSEGKSPAKPPSRIDKAKNDLRAAIKSAGLSREQAAEYAWVGTATDADYDKVAGLVAALSLGKAVN
jgi:hypothetical protein